MSKYEEKITDNSLWYTATPTPLTLTLPFYISEAGHFRAEADYKVERDELFGVTSIDFSFLLFTILNPLICIAFNHKFINFIKHYKFLQTPQRTYK